MMFKNGTSFISVTQENQDKLQVLLLLLTTEKKPLNTLALTIIWPNQAFCTSVKTNSKHLTVVKLLISDFIYVLEHMILSSHHHQYLQVHQPQHLLLLLLLLLLHLQLLLLHLLLHLNVQKDQLD